MDEFHYRREVEMVLARIAECARRKNHQRRPQAFSAAIDNIFAYLPDEPDIGVEFLADDRVYRIHILDDKTSDTFN